MLCAIAATAQNPGVLIETEAAVYRPVTKWYPELAIHSLSWRYRIAGDSLRKGDTLQVMVKTDAGAYRLVEPVVSETMAPSDSWTTIAVDCLIDDDLRLKTGNFMYTGLAGFRCGLGMRYVPEPAPRRARHLMYVQIDHSQSQRVLSLEPALEVQRFPMHAELGFDYTCIVKAATVNWQISDALGRVVLRGFLDARFGKQNYSIETAGLRPGRYTLTLGEGSAALNDHFTLSR